MTTFADEADHARAFIRHSPVLARAEADAARLARIEGEAQRAFRALADTRKAVAVFGSAREGLVPRWGALAARTVQAVSEAGFAVITGGGPGLMAMANRSARDAGGTSIGLTIELPGDEPANPYLELQVPFHYFFLRKLAFVKYACGFVCLPGGFGTLDELFEALNLKRTHRLDPFPVMLVGVDYWSGLIEWLTTTAVDEGALAPKDIDMLEVTDDPDHVVARLVDCHKGLCRDLEPYT